MPVLFTLLFILAETSAMPELIAHRGESHDAPENTLAAFQLAWDRDVPAIELDVHLTKDGKLICIHDADTERVSGRKVLVKESTLAELRQLEAGKWKGPQWAGEKLPTLDEALASIPSGRRCFIEIKVGPEAVPAAAQAIRGSGKKPAELAIISFKAPTVAECKRQMPEIPAYFLSGFKQDPETGAWKPTIDHLIQEAKKLRADGLDLSHEGPLTAEDVARVHAAGLKFYIWTVDDPAVARKFARWGVDGITTNRAEWMRQQLQAGPP